MATDPLHLLLQEEPTLSPVLVVSSVRVTTVLLLLCHPGAFAKSQSLEPLFPSPADTTSQEPSFPTTSPSRRSLGHSCHPCPPPRGHPCQARACWRSHPATSTPGSVAPSFGATQHHRSQAAGGPIESEPPQRRPSPLLSESLSPSHDRHRPTSPEPSLGATSRQSLPEPSHRATAGPSPPKRHAEMPLHQASIRSAATSIFVVRNDRLRARHGLLAHLLAAPSVASPVSSSPCPPFLHLAPTPPCPSCAPSHHFPRHPATRRRCCLHSQVLPLVPLVPYPFMCNHIANQPSLWCFLFFYFFLDFWSQGCRPRSLCYCAAASD
jgi:hypothetical protein